MIEENLDQREGQPEPNSAGRTGGGAVLDATPCCASLGEIQGAKKDRLNAGLRSLAEWCASRASGEHDTDTTLTMLEKKATALRGRVIAAGWAEIERKNAIRHNNQVEARDKWTTENTSSEAALPPTPCSALGAGDVVQRGDLFLDDYGQYLEMDNLGRLLGIRCLGETLKKSGGWFRPSKQNAKGEARADNATPPKPPTQ